MGRCRVTLFGLCLAAAINPVGAGQPDRRVGPYPGFLPRDPEELRKWMAELHQAELRGYEQQLSAYQKSHAALRKAGGELDKGDLAGAIRSLEAGYTAIRVPVSPAAPRTALGVPLDPLYTFNENAAYTVRGEVRSKFVAAIGKPVADAADPWSVFDDLLRAAGDKKASECRPYTCLLLDRAARDCADRSAILALARAEAGDWAGAAAAVSRARVAIETNFHGARSVYLRQYAAAFETVSAADRATAQLKHVATILRDGAGVPVVVDAPLDDLSPKFAHLVRGVTAADALGAAFAADQLSGDRIALSIDRLAAADPALANRVRIDLAGRLFLAGHPEKARATLGTVAGQSPAAAAALLRDLKAVALGDGTVATDAGRAAVAPKDPAPVVRQFTPDGDRAGYRPPAVGIAPPDLPPLEHALAAFARKFRDEARVELVHEPGRIERRKIEGLADVFHCRPPRHVVLFDSQIADRLTDGGELPDEWMQADAQFEDATFLMWVKLLTVGSSDETKRLVLEMRRASPEITIAQAIGRLPRPEDPKVAAAVGRRLTPTESRVAAYLIARKKTAEDVAEWLRGDAPAVAPAPRLKSDAGGAP